jgi:DNA-binding response OmpR family regulator
VLTPIHGPPLTVVGLSVDADDDVTKPFSPRELVARIRAMLRRPHTVATPVTGNSQNTVVGPLPREFGSDVDRRRRPSSLRQRKPVMLTRTEFDVLSALSSRPGMVFSRRQVRREALWFEGTV